MNRSGLGKGLSALLPEGSGESRPVAQIPVAEIRPNPYQPRREFDEEKLAELAESLRAHGLLQPVAVRPAPRGGGFELIAGERRWRAAQRAGLAAIPALVRPATDRQMLEIALVENLQREDINAIEAAEAYRRCLEEFGLTQEELAERVGKSRTAVANTLRLLKLAEPVRQMIFDGRLSEGHGRALLALVDEREQLALAQRIVLHGLSVREAERIAREGRVRPRPAPAPVRLEADLAAFGQRLQRVLGTRVELKPGNDGGGSIVIRYYTAEDLTRLAELLDR